MLRIKELNLTCMINDSERITEKLQGYVNKACFILIIRLEIKNLKTKLCIFSELFIVSFDKHQ
jgi:hypothetical protein